MKNLRGSYNPASLSPYSVKLSILGVGMVFGDEAALKNEPYKASLRCAQNDSLIYCMTREQYLSILKN